MNIRVKITRDGSNKICTMDIEEYLRGVVPAEMPSKSLVEALKTQAVAARTYAMSKLGSDRPYDVDDTTTYQAYIPHAVTLSSDIAIHDTAGQVLKYNGKLISAVYSASNGGRTRSAKERWGTAYPYLPAQDDPYNERSGYTRNGHSVGMSQRGTQQAAKEGLTYVQILAFYYPGTVLVGMDIATTYPCEMIVATKNDPLNVRKEANGEVIYKLPVGARVFVLSEKEGWCLIVYRDTKYVYGWVSSAYLRMVAE